MGMPLCWSVGLVMLGFLFLSTIHQLLTLVLGRQPTAVALVAFVVDQTLLLWLVFQLHLLLSLHRHWSSWSWAQTAHRLGGRLTLIFLVAAFLLLVSAALCLLCAPAHFPLLGVSATLAAVSMVLMATANAYVQLACTRRRSSIAQDFFIPPALHTVQRNGRGLCEVDPETDSSQDGTSTTEYDLLDKPSEHQQAWEPISQPPLIVVDPQRPSEDPARPPQPSSGRKVSFNLPPPPCTSPSRAEEAVRRAEAELQDAIRYLDELLVGSPFVSRAPY